MARGKRIIQEVAVESDTSDVEMVVPEEPIPLLKKKVTKPKEKKPKKENPIPELVVDTEDDTAASETESVKSDTAVPVKPTKPLSAAKKEALRKANEARLRVKIERELKEKKEKEDRAQHELNERIKKLVEEGISTRMQKKEPRRKKYVRSPEESSDDESIDFSYLLKAKNKETSPPPPSPATEEPKNKLYSMIFKH